MKAAEIRQKYLDFFVKRGHKIIPSAPLVPENDPTALFITAGMQPLVPYLLGEIHPLGKRLCSIQKCLRTDDIESVGDTYHHTFFEMLGNWSLGDYFKKEAIEWSYEFLTSKEWLGIDKEKLAVSVFAGDKDAPFDQESYDLWLKLGIPPARIAKLPKKNNWWGPAGQTGPCGPDTEMFVWAGKDEAPQEFNADDPTWIEAWNDVFMEFNKKIDGTFEPLKQKNVDTGMGLERITAVLSGTDDDYKTELFWPTIEIIEQKSNKNYSPKKDNRKVAISASPVISATGPMRIIADHLKAATFLMVDGVSPSKDKQGYILRRLIRRATDEATKIGYIGSFEPIFNEIINIYKKDYPEIEGEKELIIQSYENEKEKYDEISYSPSPSPSEVHISGEEAFRLFSTHGQSPQILRDKGYEFDQEEFNKAFKKHQELSRTASAGMFKGGLADHSEEVTKLHTATHLLHAALRKILGVHVQQKGSNITAERLRFDFLHPRKLTEEEIRKIEELVNQKITENLPVTMEVMDLKAAQASGALGFFEHKYGDKVKVYSIGDFSVEICGGPHVNFTASLGRFKIIKEEAAGAGVRRIYGNLNPI